MRAISLIFIFIFALKSNAQDSLRYCNERTGFSTQQLVAPAVLFAGGFATNNNIKLEIARIRNEQIPNFHTRADDVLSVAPIFIAYGLDALGVRSKNDFWNRSAILLKGELMAIGAGYALKFSTQVTRPDGSDNHSFPSNHAAQAFLAATFLSEEYKHTIRWMPYAAYTVASSVAALRIANNRHYLSDVLVGAGIGILSQKAAYWTHQYRWGKRKSVKHF
ncbi:MAG: phosphatase PAP2 family protein [Chitinophagaceae bacterium]|nr:phosphatase PAP2 family protein [Chitinophagaceae bacterium]